MSKDRGCTSPEPPVPLLDFPQGKKGFHFIVSEPLVSTYTHCFLSSHHEPLWRAWHSLLENLLVGMGKYCWLSPSATSLSCLICRLKPRSLSLSSQAVCSTTLILLGVFCWTCSTFSMSFCCQEVQNWKYWRCGLMNVEQRVLNWAVSSLYNCVAIILLHAGLCICPWWMLWGPFLQSV